MAKHAHYSASTLSEAAAGRSLPSLEVTLAYVRACGGDPAEWEDRWRQIAAELAPPDTEDQDDSAAPYLGLSTFGTEDAHRFFGRDRIVDDLLARLTRQRFLAVFGPSGSGKSSLLRAGLLPAVDDERMPGGPWPTLLFTPGEHPLEECAVQVGQLLGVSPGALLADLVADPSTLNLALRQALIDHPADTEVLLVVDQFEELFTACQDTTQRDQFIAALLSAAQAHTSRTRIVLGIRADFYGRCAEHPDLVEALHDTQVLIGSMTAAELRSAITQPATHAGLSVEATLVSTIITEMIGRPGALPLMSHALLETWRRRKGTTLTLAAYQATGGIDGALTRTAERTYTTLTPTQQHTARAILLRLTALGEGTEDTRRRTRRSELDNTPTTTEVLHRLAQARLVTLGEDTLEITHEALIRSWPRLRGWLTEDRDGLRVHRQLTDATHTWETLNHDPGVLYRGTRLAVAQDWLTRHATTLTERERAFLDASTTAQTQERRVTRRRTRRLRILVVTLAALAGLATTATVVAVVQRSVAVQQRQAALDQNKLATSRELATQATALAAAQPEAAALVAVEAFHQAPTLEARSALLSVQGQFTGISPSINLSPFESPFTQAIFSPDGRFLNTPLGSGRKDKWALLDTAVGRSVADLGEGTFGGFSRNGRVLVMNSSKKFQLWDTSTGNIISSIDESSAQSTVALSPDGRILATSSLIDPRVTLREVTTGREINTLTTALTTPHAIAAMAFSPDGRTLATADLSSIASHNQVTLLEVPTGREISTLTITFTRITGMDFSPDGSTLATITNSPSGQAQSPQQVQLWDLRTGHIITTASQFTNEAVRVAFSPEGHTLVTVGTYPTNGITALNGQLRVWDARGTQQIATISEPFGQILDMAYTSDNTLIASGRDGLIRRFDLNPDTVTEHLCQILKSKATITQDRWAQYLPNLPFQPTCR
nr:hypothetical protein [Actinocrispum wychmicini]